MPFRFALSVGAGLWVVYTLGAAVSPVSAQEWVNSFPRTELANNQDEGLQEIGQTAETGTGEVGQRLKREDIALNTTPLARINNRVENRVENRLSSRVESHGYRNTDVTSSFRLATARTRNAPLSSESTSMVGENQLPR